MTAALLDIFAMPPHAGGTSLRRVADVVSEWLVTQGVTLAFGVSGGGVGAVWHALAHTPAIRVIHTAHESGAAFAATEASLTTGRPVVVFTTTGPGLTNALTGIIAARQEGARVLLISGATPAGRLGRGATQATDESGPIAGLYTPGPLFDAATLVHTAEQLAPTLQRAAEVLSRPSGGVVHIGIPTDLQGAQIAPPLLPPLRRAPLTVDPGVIDALIELRNVCVVVGFGARDTDVRALVERTGWRAVCTPRGKGIVPETHPAHLGVIGVAGHDAAEQALAGVRPEVVVALGTTLGEASSGWSEALRPSRLLVLVDGRGDALAGAYPNTPLLCVHAEVSTFVEAVLARLPAVPPAVVPRPVIDLAPARTHGPVRPSYLFGLVQRIVIDATDALLYAESGNSFTWAIHQLRLTTPRLRVSVGWGSMGHVSSGAIGAAAAGRRVVALVGDGAMLMGNELATAARDGLPVTWIVLNDGQYGMCRHGMDAIGLAGVDTDLAPIDFAGLARALGVQAESVASEAALADALTRLSTCAGPALLDVRTDREERGPIGRRVRALSWQAEVQ